MRTDTLDVKHFVWFLSWQDYGSLPLNKVRLLLRFSLFLKKRNAVADGWVLCGCKMVNIGDFRALKVWKKVVFSNHFFKTIFCCFWDSCSLVYSSICQLRHISPKFYSENHPQDDLYCVFSNPYFCALPVLCIQLKKLFPQLRMICHSVKGSCCVWVLVPGPERPDGTR